MLVRAGSYEALYDGFRWNLPEQLTMAAQVCDYWAGTAPDRVAIIDETGRDPAGKISREPVAAFRQEHAVGPAIPRLCPDHQTRKCRFVGFHAHRSD